MDDPHRNGRPPEPRSDEALMLSFRDGDARAFEELVARHRRGLFNFLLRSVQNRSRAEELLQEVFLRVVRSKDRYERTAKLTTWLYTIARNLCVDESRRASSAGRRRSTRRAAGSRTRARRWWRLSRPTTCPPTTAPLPRRSASGSPARSTCCPKTSARFSNAPDQRAF
ncbi:sigma-70 family RNA polymerase sigma factor [Nannocystis pusilla]|uniref:sigma-70 family RNA polymerase sigma factor n=1 Tax=Nannocystis pusilla TaxID=889268 RepID=UPI003B79CAD8